jgi:chromatin remodeling complex protein RSC6
MSTSTETPIVNATESKVPEITSSDTLKTILSNLNDQVTNMKNLMNVVRVVLKDTDRQTKELEKLRNKRSRIKTERSANALPSGITKPVTISEELASFLNVSNGTLVPRNEVTKGVSAYVKLHGLSDPKNKQKFVLDDRPTAKVLASLLGNPAEDVTYFNLQRYLKHHYISDGTESSKKKKSVPAPESVPETPEPPSTPAPVKKKIVVVKKKPATELTEEA